VRGYVALLAVGLAACGASAARPDEGLARVAEIHGAAGPWAVAGYRMGRYALTKLGLSAQSFDLEVTHHTPAMVQYSCIADGAAASTGASVGKLNLKLIDAPEAEVMTTYLRKSTGRSVTLRPTAAFRARFVDLPREKLQDAGREVMALPDAEVFEEVPARP
jgi:formylmethanofuran dehydrogenase subunit E